ncbi:MAG TPA: hypothetical protein PKK10_01555 [Woeseiaceae bacterium]|nr:hypothetical protein [Woeseiaceae bacterium]
MADRNRDEQDRVLDALFDSAPIADDGFSAAVVASIQRKQRFRRWCVSIALVVGSAIAIKPTIAMLHLLYKLLFDTSTGLFAFSVDSIPSVNMLITGGILFAVLMVGLRVIDD